MFCVPRITFLKARSPELKSNLVLLAWFRSAMYEERISIRQSFSAVFDVGAAAIRRVCRLHSAIVGATLSFARDLGVSSLDKIILANYLKDI